MATIGSLANSTSGQRPRVKVLTIVNEAYFYYSHRAEIGRAAVANGYEVTVAAPDDFVWVSPDFELGDLDRIGVQFIRLPISRRGQNLLVELATIWRLWQIIRLLRPTLVHTLTIKPTLYGGLVCRLAGVPAVVYGFTGLGHVFSASGVIPAVRRFVVSVLLRVAVGHRNSMVMCQNRGDAEQLVRRRIVASKNIVLTTGSGVDLGKYQPDENKQTTGNFTVLFAARLIWDKGVAEFAEIARLVRKSDPSIRFVLAGDTQASNPRAVPKSTIESWVREGVLEWSGFQGDMVSLYREANLFCYPSTYGEGVPRVLLEAGSCGLPIVAFDISGTREVIESEENGVLVPKGDVAAAAEAILSLARDREMHRRLSQRARSIAVARFGVDRVVETTMNVYEKTLSSVIVS